MSSITPTNRKITMQISALKSQKASGSLSNVYVNDWEKRERIRIRILYLVSRHFQRSD